jgi:cytochrome bd-type quinol oxidase subunit 2
MAKLTNRPQPPLPPVSPGGPPRKAPPRKTLPPASPALHQRSWAALTLAALSLLALMMISGSNIRRTVVVVVVALVIAALGLYLAVTALRAARRAGTARPRGSVLGTVLAVLGLAFGAFVLAGFAMFWPQLTGYSDCMRGAATVSAQDACHQQLDNSVNSQMKILSGR